MPTTTEEENCIYLIGEVNGVIDGSNLPSCRQVLSVFFYKHKCLNFSVRKSASDTIKTVEHFWSQHPESSTIPICRTQHSIRKLEKLHGDWIKIQKNRLRTNSSAQKSREEDYEKKLDKLFDIARYDAEETLTEQQKIFLISQKIPIDSATVSTRADDTEPIDNGSTEYVAADFIHEIAEDADINDPSQPVAGPSRLSQSLTQSSDASSLKRTISNFEDEMSPEDEPKPKKINIMTQALACALDRTNTTSRNATYIIAATASSLGFDVNDINLSSSTIHRSRIKFREQVAKQLKENLRVANCLVVHWDGKLLPDITGTETVERLPIIVSGVGTEQLLGVPSLLAGTGENQATAIVNTLFDWNLSQRVKAMCFDTTSTNTGRLNGACTLVEQQLDKKLLHLACRHHIYELLLRSVVEIYWPTTSGPNVPIFKRFNQSWSKIDTKLYETGFEDQSVAEMLFDRKQEILRFIQNQFNEKQPRDDYKEFLELACIFLGGEPPRGVRFKKPGAMHHARWLSKALYSLKMFMFRRQFTLTARETNGLRHICVFIVNFYVESWFCAPSAIKAPNYDLQLLQRLIAYQNVNADVSKAARSKLAAHLWYLSDELACLAFFDEAVPIEVKAKMAQAIRQREYSVRKVRPVIKEREFESLLCQDISDFITKQSIFLFEQFQLPYGFLDLTPEMWQADKSFNDCRCVLSQLKVVNDIAERGVALIEEYNNSLTKNEDQKQYLLQVVKNHRHEFPNANKKNFAA